MKPTRLGLCGGTKMVVLWSAAAWPAATTFARRRRRRRGSSGLSAGAGRGLALWGGRAARSSFPVAGPAQEMHAACAQRGPAKPPLGSSRSDGIADLQRLRAAPGGEGHVTAAGLIIFATRGSTLASFRAAAKEPLVLADSRLAHRISSAAPQQLRPGVHLRGSESIRQVPPGPTCSARRAKRRKFGLRRAHKQCKE